MSMEDFELIGENLVRCKTCGEEIVTGIVRISEHWVSCTGFCFTVDLIKEAENYTLTLGKIEELQDKHLKK